VRLIEQQVRPTVLKLSGFAPQWLPWSIGGGCVAIALIDWFTPLGIAITALYLIPVSLTVGTPGRWTSRLVGLLCLSLTITGAFYSPAGIASIYGLVNRSLTGFAIIMAVMLVDRFKQHLVAVSRLEAQKLFLAESQSQIVESAPNGILMVNQEGIITLMNGQIECLFGYDRQELVGQPIELLIPERFRSGHPTQRTTFFHHPVHRSMGVDRELFGCRKDGTEFPLEIGLNPIKTSDGLQALASIVDITARKLTETQLKETTQQLASMNIRLMEAHQSDLAAT